MKTILSYIWLPITFLIPSLLLIYIELTTGKGGTAIIVLFIIAMVASREIAKDMEWFK